MQQLKIDQESRDTLKNTSSEPRSRTPTREASSSKEVAGSPKVGSVKGQCDILYLIKY